MVLQYDTVCLMSWGEGKILQLNKGRIKTNLFQCLCTRKQNNYSWQEEHFLRSLGVPCHASHKQWFNSTFHTNPNKLGVKNQLSQSCIFWVLFGVTSTGMCKKMGTVLKIVKVIFPSCWKPRSSTKDMSQDDLANTWITAATKLKCFSHEVHFYNQQHLNIPFS